jgi:trk system potassium uptake protein TrkA
MILIIGCGRLGASLATRLSQAGHEIVVVDHLRENLTQNLPRDFRGRPICGMEIDADVLRRAGIERADHVVIVSRDENTNMMSADVARHLFGIKRVVVRIDQPDCARRYREEGFEVISPVLESARWVEERIQLAGTEN